MFFSSSANLGLMESIVPLGQLAGDIIWRMEKWRDACPPSVRRGELAGWKLRREVEVLIGWCAIGFLLFQHSISPQLFCIPSSDLWNDVIVKRTV